MASQIEVIDVKRNLESIVRQIAYEFEITSMRIVADRPATSNIQRCSAPWRRYSANERTSTSPLRGEMFSTSPRIDQFEAVATRWRDAAHIPPTSARE